MGDSLRAHFFHQVSNKSLIRIGVFCLVLNILLLGCQSSAGVTPSLPTSVTPGQLPLGWETRWLKGIPCRAPCWEGITPGKTTASEAVDILRKSPLVNEASISQVPTVRTLGLVEWIWVNGQAGGTALFRRGTSPEVIYELDPHLPKSIRLADVIAAYGEPSDVTAGEHLWTDYQALQGTPGPGTSAPITYRVYSLSLFYLPYGFFLSTGGSSKPDLSPELVLERSDFFAPGMEGYLDTIGGKPIPYLTYLPWQGFKGFQFYCRDDDGKLCKE